MEIYAQGFYEDSFKNAIPGTVLDKGVTQSNENHHEFYMLTQSSRFGISLPTKCGIFHSSISETMDKLQLLTYKLCHTYFNHPKAMREPAPILYAQKLAC